MKSSDVQRDIVSRHGRVGGEAPVLGRVARMRDVDTVGQTTPTRHLGGSAGRGHRPATLIWSSVISVATLIVIGLAVSSWLLPQLSRKGAAVAGNAEWADSSVRVASRFPSPSRQEALHLVKRALSNRDPLHVRDYFREGGAGSAEILAFLVAAEERDGPAERYEWLSCMDVGGLLMEGVLVVYPGKERPMERLAFLTPDAAGNWKLDFDAFARSVTPS